MKYEKKVALKSLKTLHLTHKNFSRTLLKNMHSYLHNNHSNDYFKRVVQLLPLNSEVLDMELLELYLTILIRIFNELVASCLKKGMNLKKAKRDKITKIVLASILETARNYSILRE